MSDLEQYFPPAYGQYVVGPTVELLWGEGGMFTASLGIFIEFPSPTRIIIAGKLHLLLPVPKAAVADVEMDLLGDVDFTAKLVAIDALLRNSRIAAFTLTGQAALRASWGRSRRSSWPPGLDPGVQASGQLPPAQPAYVGADPECQPAGPVRGVPGADFQHAAVRGGRRSLRIARRPGGR